jgi:hypothetical protein
MNVTVHDTAKRPWGLETLVTVEGDDGRVHNFAVAVKPEDTAAQIADKAVAMIVEPVDMPESPEAVLMSEIETLTAQKEALLQETADLVLAKDVLEAELIAASDELALTREVK